MPLTDVRIRKEQPRQKSFRLTDEKGLYLEIAPNGSKYWRFKYRFAGKEKLLAIGVYGDVSLKQAREKRDTARRQLHQLTGRGQYVFSGLRSAKRPMSENTVNAALRRLGYSREQMTGHGFRSIASTMLNEQGWHRDAIERQLAHGERDSVRAAYNYAEYLGERRRMMQAWADYLESLQRGEVVVPLRAA